MEDTNQTLEEAQALNRITLDLLNQKKKEHFRLWLVILALILVNLIEAGLFIWYESQMETTTSTTTTTTVEQDTGDQKQETQETTQSINTSIHQSLKNSPISSTISCQLITNS